MEDLKHKHKDVVITRNNNVELVVTGTKPDEWKLKYIEAFNKIEQVIKNPFPQMQNLDLANLIRKQQFVMSLKLFKQYIDICKELGIKPTLEGASKFKRGFMSR